MSADVVVHCSEHPTVELVRAYDWYAPVNVQADQRMCPQPSHGHAGGHRCARCGGPIGGRRAYAAVYCGTRCRVAALRARNRVTPSRRVASVTPNPGNRTGGKSPAVAASQEVQE